MNSLIFESVNKQRCMELRYHGYSRVVEPHAYGRDKGGDEVLRCYQTSGGSVSGERAGWKLLKVCDVYSLHLLKEVFIARKDYKKGDKAMEYIFAQL